MNNQIKLNSDTTLECNRCYLRSAPTDAEGEITAIRDGKHTYRVQQMLTLGCGHRDGHWYFAPKAEDAS